MSTASALHRRRTQPFACYAFPTQHIVKHRIPPSLSRRLYLPCRTVLVSTCRRIPLANPPLPNCRLYTAPVESDVQAKPEAEKTSSHARSAIRRTRTVRQAYADLDSRRRAAIAAATEERISGGRRRLADDFNRGFADTSAPGPSEPSGRTLPSSADSYAQARAVAIFHERFDRLHAAAISNQPSNENSRVPGSSTRASGGILPESSVRDWESSSAGPVSSACHVATSFPLSPCPCLVLTRSISDAHL